MNRRKAVVACLLAASASTALAERADREKQIVVAGDRAVADDAQKTLVFDGNVVITQGTMRMTANKVTVREDKDKHQYYVANGAPVTFRQKRDNVDEWIEGFADRAEFDDRRGRRVGALRRSRHHARAIVRRRAAPGRAERRRTSGGRWRVHGVRRYEHSVASKQ